MTQVPLVYRNAEESAGHSVLPGCVERNAGDSVMMSIRTRPIPIG
jgi:hypothetical protein